MLILDALDRAFKVRKSGSTIKTEVFSGLTAYFTVVYILFLVPVTLMSAFPEAFDASGELIGTAVLSNGVTAAQMLVSLTVVSCIAAAIGTFLMAFGTNLPFAQAPSLSIGTFVAFTICVKMGYTYNQALAAIFIGGIVFFIISIMGIEKKVQDAIPTNIKFAVTAGIGLFIAFMGMQKAHLVETNARNLVQIVNFRDVANYNTRSALLCLAGIILIAVMLIKEIHGAILIGKIVCIVIAIPLGLVAHNVVDYTAHSISIAPVAFQMDFAGLFSSHEFGLGGAVISVIVIISSLCVMDVFETLGTIIAMDHILVLSKEGSIEEKLPKLLKIDAIATVCGAAFGISNVSTNVESTAMALEGGRTGLSGVVSGLLFLVTIFIAPYASVVPSAATATTLIMSGILMMNVIKYINFEDVENALPAFFTMALMPLTYSIVTGIAVGLISHTLIQLFIGKGRELKKGTYIMTLLFFVQLFFISK